jgi:D-tagatose-1,6-bisphosphate aldolase subunit GatZ/KbaZ
MEGIYAACSANAYVIRACMERAMEEGSHVLVEATANQVNQFGGYTGMTPAGFRDHVIRIAGETGFPLGKIILGGDHLGPLVWHTEASPAAMSKAAELVRQYVLAGFSKIHVDTSM